MLYLPAFSFNFIGEENFLDFNNLSIVEISCIIIISILIIIAIGLSCFLLCRKNRNPNNEIKTGKFIELESINIEK